MKSPALTRLENEMNEFARYFEVRYFGKCVDDVHWVSEEIGGVYVIADYFFDMRSMTDFVRYSYSKKDMFDYYEYTLSEPKPLICIRDWKKLIK